MISQHADDDAKTIGGLVEAGVPNVRSVTIADSGHLMSQEQPARFNEAVLTFLGDLARSRTSE